MRQLMRVQRRLRVPYEHLEVRVEENVVMSLVVHTQELHRPRELGKLHTRHQKWLWLVQH